MVSTAADAATRDGPGDASSQPAKAEHGPWRQELVLAAVSGLLLFGAGYPGQRPWLQLVAFVPLVVTCLRASSWRHAAVLGAVFALARFLPMGWMLDGLDLPLLPALGLTLYLVALDALFAVSILAARRLQPAAVGFAIGASYALIEWIDALLPMWGTARSLARAWAINPEPVVDLLRFGGPHTLAFIIVAAQAIVVVAVRQRSWLVAMELGMLVAVVAGVQGWPEPAREGTLRLAAIGWPARGGESQAEALVADAADHGAALVVLPEAAFRIEAGEREAFMARWRDVARLHRIHLVVAYIDREDPGNRLVVFDPRGEPIGIYTKTHMIPVSETLPPGDGTRLVFEIDGVRIGTLICQDDNFRDLTAAYADDGVDIIVVPTNEGPPAVAPYHYRNARLRPIEYPITLVRAASRGTSAVVAPGGEVVASVDHVREGAGALVVDAPY